VKSRSIIYAPEAGDDLDWIYDTIAGAGSPDTADHYSKRIRAFCERLEHGSERGTLRNDVRAGLRVVGFEKRVAVAFLVEEERVVILRIFYGGVNWEDKLRE